MDTDRCKHGMTHLRSGPSIFILSFLSYRHNLDHDNTELTLKQQSDNTRKECITFWCLMRLIIDAVGYNAELTLNRHSGTNFLRTCQI